jgi:gamma-glutamylcyclotransferase
LPIAASSDAVRESALNDRWYFAYGSNLSVDQKELRTGTIRSSVRCQLLGYRLAFNKRASSGGVYANVMPNKPSAVWGVAYLCDENAIAALDRCEGVSGGHYRHEGVEVVTDGGEVLHALTYVAGDDFVCAEGRPRNDYLRKILDGARHHRLPDDYIASIEALGAGPAG